MSMPDPRSLLLARSLDAIAGLRAATPEDPLRVLLSGCLFGLPCGVEGTDYGLGAAVPWLAALSVVSVTTFCPEAHGMGVPRAMPDIHGGDGFDVLDGRARVLDENGADLTAAMLAGARAMLERARAHRAELAVLTDMSAACGSQVISDGCRFDEPRRYQVGVGVATALLLRSGTPVVSQRDHRTLGALRARLDPTFSPAADALDHHESAWVRATFASADQGPAR
jgi:uncharacterized protein YbbK (DUF523 family)